MEGIEKINTLRSKREGKFVMDRLNVNKKVALKAAHVTVRRHHNVLQAAAAGLKVSNEGFMEPEEWNLIF